LYDKKIKRRNIAAHLKHRNYTLIEEDIRNLKAIERIFRKNHFHRVFHIAARAGVRASIENPRLYEEVNIGGTLNILECMRKHPAGGLIYASSSSIYGETGKIPFSEDDKADCPVSPYAASKKAGELFCYTYHSLYNIPVACLRFFTVYGPRQRPEMAIHYFTRAISIGEEIKLFGDGSTQRDYTYIDDIVSGITSLLDKDFGFEIINMGNSHTVELKYLVSLIEKNLKKKARIQWLPEQPGDVPVTRSDISKAKRLLGYNPKTNIEEGISKFVKWYLNEAV
jgi:UDP-glucuronate 4-epimerase